MSTLRVRFSGLCLLRGKEVDIIHGVPAKTSRDQKHNLHVHTPQLWVEGVAPATQRDLIIAKDLCFVKSETEAECRPARIYALEQKEVLRVVASGLPAIAWTGANRPPSIKHQLHSTVDGLRGWRLSKFKVEGGTWSAGPRFDVKWTPGLKLDKLSIWYELAIPFSQPSIFLGSSHVDGGWELYPNAGEVIIWLTSYPDSGHAGHGHHFKWFYERIKFSGAVPSSLKYPALVGNLPRCNPPCELAGGPTGTVFCPDAGYP